MTDKWQRIVLLTRDGAGWVGTRPGNWLAEGGSNFKVEGLETSHFNRFRMLTGTNGGPGQENYLLWLIMTEIDRTREWRWDFFFFSCKEEALGL